MSSKYSTLPDIVIRRFMVVGMVVSWLQKKRLGLLKNQKCIQHCSKLNRIPNPMCTRLLMTRALVARESRAWMERQVQKEVARYGRNLATFYFVANSTDLLTLCMRVGERGCKADGWILGLISLLCLPCLYNSHTLIGLRK